MQELPASQADDEKYEIELKDKNDRYIGTLTLDYHSHCLPLFCELLFLTIVLYVRSFPPRGDPTSIAKSWQWGKLVAAQGRLGEVFFFFSD